jgi:hypothetical protein
MHFGEEFRYLLHNDGKVLVFRQADFAFYGRPPWVDHLDPVMLDFYRLADKDVAYRELLRRGFSFVFVPNPAATPTAYYNSQAAQVTADPSLSELVAQRVGAVYRLRDRPADVNCQDISPEQIVLEGYRPSNFVEEQLLTLFGWEPAIRSLVERPFGPGTLRSASPRGNTHRVTGIVFRGIDVSDDASTEASAFGTRRLSIGLDLAGDGIAEVILHVRNKDAALVEARSLWSGLLNQKARRVNLQSAIPSAAHELSLLVRKSRTSVGLVEVNDIRLCRFEGPPTADR